MHVQGCLILSQVGLLFPVNHAPESGVPGRLRSGDLLPEKQACWLNYTTGTGRSKPLAGLFHRLTPNASESPGLAERVGPLELFRVQGFEMVRASGNAPELGTDLVRRGV